MQAKPVSWNKHRWRLWLATFLSILNGCSTWQRPESPEFPEKISHSLSVLPLPGGLNQQAVLYSNNPERIEQSGILVSTLPGTDLSQARKLNTPLRGEFQLFMHHVARTAVLSNARIYLAILAETADRGPARLQLTQGAFFRTWPEAPFLPLTGIHANAEGDIFSGPGDRLALAWLRRESPLKPMAWTLKDTGPQLIFLEAIPTNPLWVLQQDNALSALLGFQSDSPVHVSVLAWVAPDGLPPTPGELQALLDSGQVAGPAEVPATAYDPDQKPPAGVFRYGRVAGLTRGSLWQGTLTTWPEGPGERIAYPLASVYLKRYGTTQNQSAPIQVRVPGSAIESHGNYGVRYRLEATLTNPDRQPRRYAVYLHHPFEVRPLLFEPPQAIFLLPPIRQVSFRGTLRLRWGEQHFWRHQVLHIGEQASALQVLELPAGQERHFELELVYPPDAIPPQLLEFQRLS
jgi:hypothetical protein